MIRLPWRRADAAQAGPAFDALIDLGPDTGADPGAVVCAVRAMAGAGWINAECHGAPGITVRLFPPGSSQAADWPDLHRAVEAVVRGVLPARAEARWSLPAAPPVSGFAEAMSATQFDALEQLAALASRPQPARRDPDQAGMTARLLGFVLPENAEAVAAAALRRFGSYAAILAAPEAELRAVPGLGTHSIAAIKLVHAAAVRLARAAVASAPVLDDPARLAAYLAAALARERVEQFRILFLDARGMLTADEVQATGTVNHTPVYPREVVRRALALGAASLILVHNHPSGDPEPSREDVEMTRQVQAAAKVMGVAVRDHVIIGNGRWLSFKEAGLLGTE